MGHFNPILVIILIIRAPEISGGNYGFMTSVKNVFIEIAVQRAAPSPIHVNEFICSIRHRRTFHPRITISKQLLTLTHLSVETGRGNNKAL